MFRSLQARFNIFLVIILTIAIGVSSYLQLRVHYNQLLDMSREKLSDLAEVIEKSIRDPLRVGRVDEVNKIISQVGTLPDLERVLIFSQNGTIVMSSRPADVGAKIDERELEIFHHQQFTTVFNQKQLEQPIFYVLRPLLNTPDCFRCHGNNPNQLNGVLAVEVSMAKIHERLAKSRRLMAISAGVTLLLLVCSIIFLLSHLVKRPIDRLISTMRQARGGDLKARVVPDDTLEFSELGRKFNEMIDKLETAQVDLKKYHEQQMERAERLASLGELAAGIAHEIKNPIAGISGAMQVLMQDFEENDGRREIMEEILKQIERIDRDVKDLLSYAKTAEPELAPKDVGELINEAIFLIREPAMQQQVRIITAVAEDLPMVLLDEKLIQQVLVNLELNAVQAMPNGGTLTITARRRREPGEADSLAIEVRDTGCGIEPDKIDKIFTPFFTTRHTGTGLGLSISQNMVRAHEGRLEVTSEPGHGSCFVILLPLRGAA